MKVSELVPRSACLSSACLVTLEPSTFGDANRHDSLFRAHMLKNWGSTTEKMRRLSGHLNWNVKDVTDYFRDVDVDALSSVPIQGLLEPEIYQGLYLDSVSASGVSVASLQQISAPPPLVSWLVPARNEEAFIHDCLASIEAQKDAGPGSHEIVLVDDASEDNTLAMMRQFAETRPHVRVIANTSQLGVAGCLVEGWKQCRGDFVARIDADDIAEPERLKKQVAYLNQHPSVSVLGGRTQSFWTEDRKCTVEKIAEKADGRVVAVVWREFHGNQTSRKREQVCFVERDDIVIEEGPAEYLGCRLLRVADTSLASTTQGWRAALREVQGGVGEVILQRRDPLEQPQGSSYLHPLLLRAALVFEDSIAGTTAMFRKATFTQEGPYQREAAEGHWCWLSLGPSVHAANLTDTLVQKRRHAGNRATRDAAGTYESACAAVHHHLTQVCGVSATMADASAFLNFRGPHTAEQGAKQLTLLHHLEQRYVRDYVRPAGDHDEFWCDFIQGREKALERTLVMLRRRYKVLVDRVSEVITSSEEPRERRSRTPPR